MTMFFFFPIEALLKMLISEKVRQPFNFWFSINKLHSLEKFWKKTNFSWLLYAPSLAFLSHNGMILVCLCM